MPLLYSLDFFSEFGRWVWRAGQQTLNKTESINEDLNYWGEVWTHPPSGDREANFLNPEDLHDYTWDTINSTEKFIFTAKSSPCIANAKVSWGQISCKKSACH